MRQKLTITVHMETSKDCEAFMITQAFDYAARRLADHVGDIVHDNGKGYFTMIIGPSPFDTKVIDFEWKKERWK